MIKTGLVATCLTLLLSAHAAMAQGSRVHLILDSDANNELDDQHAIAYLLFNADVFDVDGITVNATDHGGDVAQHREEAERVVELCGLAGTVPVITGANGDFQNIRSHLAEPDFDGAEAVRFIVDRVTSHLPEQTVLLPIGKLTNIALALQHSPAIMPHVRIVWLGSNYPAPGEYNQDNDIAALNYILDQDVAFEIVTVRYGQASGTAAVTVTPEEIRQRVAGKGPRADPPVMGRHGTAFRHFGDYSADLFSHARMRGNPPGRALFDLAAVAIVKNPDWARVRSIPAPRLVDAQWVERPSNPRRIFLWEDFDRDAIIEDFIDRLEHPVLNKPAPASAPGR
jgi:inosine-uridine nucleoside N-ribohydrolase